MYTIFLKTIKEKWILTLSLILISIGTVWMYVALFPTIQTQSKEFEKLLATFPPELWEVFGIQNSNFSMSTLEKFLSVEMYSLLWPMMAIIMVINFGANFIAGEIDKGTMEILLSQPISRIKIYISKVFGGIALISIFNLISIICIIFWAKIYNIEYNFDVYPKMLLMGELFLLAGFGISILFSTILEKGKAVFVISGIFLVMYILNIVSVLKKDLDILKYFSFFHYLDMSKVLTTNVLDAQSIWVLSLVTIISLIIGLIWFEKKDINM
jgi:ABC-2 type transport system permease protein